MRMQLTLSAEKLKNTGTFRDRISDPYAEVEITGGPYEGTHLGRTETIQNNLSPEWTKVIFVQLDDKASYMPFRVTILDENDGRREDKIMVQADFVDVLSVHQSQGHQQGVDVVGGGKVYATVTKSVQGTDEGSFEVHVRGRDIKNVELGVLQLGASDPFMEIRKKSADHAAGVVRWIPVYRSEVIMDNLNPFWEAATIDLEELCNCNLDWPLKICVVDWQRNGQHREIGSVETNIGDIISRITKKSNADIDNALVLSSEEKAKRRGLVIVLAARVMKK